MPQRKGKGTGGKTSVARAEEADRDKKRAAKVLEQKEEEAANKAKRIAEAKKVESEKVAEEKEGDVEMECINVDDNTPISREGGVNATTSSRGGKDTEEMRVAKKARKERKKARKEKRAKEEAEATKGTPAATAPAVTSPPAGLRCATSNFSSPLKSLKFDKYSHTFKREHATASVILSQDKKYNKLAMKIRMLVGQA